MSYLFMCPQCDNVHDIAPPSQFSKYTAALPERECDVCNVRGCVDCIPDEPNGLDNWCADCKDRE